MLQNEHYFIIAFGIVIVIYLIWCMVRCFNNAHAMPESLRFEFYGGKKNCFTHQDAVEFYVSERDIRKIRNLHMNIYDAETGKFLKRVTCSEYFE